jgi:hypothetical protein
VLGTDIGSNFRGRETNEQPSAAEALVFDPQLSHVSKTACKRASCGGYRRFDRLDQIKQLRVSRTRQLFQDVFVSLYRSLVSQVGGMHFPPSDAVHFFRVLSFSC